MGHLKTIIKPIGLGVLLVTFLFDAPYVSAGHRSIDEMLDEQGRYIPHGMQKPPSPPQPPTYQGPSPAELERQRQKQKQIELRRKREEFQRQKQLQKQRQIRAKNEANNKGNDYFGRGNWDKAISYYKEALKYDPSDQTIKRRIKQAQAHKASDKGDKYHNKGDWGNAIKYYKEALRYDPNNAIFRRNLKKAEAEAKKERQEKLAEAKKRQQEKRLREQDKKETSAETSRMLDNLVADIRRPGSSGLWEGAARPGATAATGQSLDFVDSSVVDLRDAKTFVVDPAKVKGDLRGAPTDLPAGQGQGRTGQTAPASTGPGDKLVQELDVATAHLPMAAREQDEFEKMNEAWLQKQQKLIREAVERDNRWTKEIMNSINADRVPPPPPNALQPGDILLIAPEMGDRISNIIAITDHFYRGEVFKAAREARGGFEAEEGSVSHALTFLGYSAGGQALYLDHTPFRGSHIIGETEFQETYGRRDQYVARPKAKLDGRRLLEVALEAAQRTREGKGVLDWTDYGVHGEKNAVCSERAAFAVVKASGTRLPLKPKYYGLGPVDITPTDFFDEEKNGKYFTIHRRP